jgi:hypothetical protein
MSRPHLCPAFFERFKITACCDFGELLFKWDIYVRFGESHVATHLLFKCFPEETFGELLFKFRTGAEFRELHVSPRLGAALLAKYHGDGLTHRDIATEIDISQQQVTRLLRYHRFVALMPTGIKITEGKFRQYWNQVCATCRTARFDNCSYQTFVTRGKQSNVAFHEEPVCACARISWQNA